MLDVSSELFKLKIQSSYKLQDTKQSDKNIKSNYSIQKNLLKYKLNPTINIAVNKNPNKF
jgi:hypothetical protein